MDLNKLVYFRAVAREGNLSKACKIVHLSQPALSLQIQGLEEDIGFKLFERHNRGLKLTPTGEKLFSKTTELEQWIAETNQMLGEEGEIAGEVKVGTYTTASSYLISPKLRGFFELHPKVSINYDYSSMDEILRKVKNFELDCAILSEVPDDPLLTSVPFFKNKLLLAASGKNKKIPKKITPKELSKFPFLSYPLRFDYCFKEVERKYGKFLKQTHISVESESFDTLKQSLIHDLGITFMPEYLIEDELKKGIVKEVTLEGPKLPILFSFVARKDSQLLRQVEAFKEYILNS